MRILMVLDGGEQPGRPPVASFERFLGPYYLFIDAGFEVVLASPLGGDPSMSAMAIDAMTPP